MTKRFLVFDTEAEAAAWERTLFEVGKPLAQAAGLHVEGDVIHGKRAGLSDLSRTPTVAYDVPRQRADGKWVILHPENNPAASNTEVLTQLVEQVEKSNIPAELYGGSWFAYLT